MIIAAPPHGHCLIAVDACQAGKDICLQKPMSPHVAETFAIKQAVERHKRISQVGTQVHAGETHKIVEDLEATRLALPVYRGPWRFPTEYVSG